MIERMIERIGKKQSVLVSYIPTPTSTQTRHPTENSKAQPTNPDMKQARLPCRWLQHHCMTDLQ